MAQFTFEGDFQILADPQIKLVESVLQKRGFKDGKVLVQSMGEKGDNYIALVKRFIYQAKDGATFKMIGKIAPVAEGLRAMMKVKSLFNNEIIMYSVVFPKFHEIQNKAGVTENEKVRFPICYGVVTEAPFEFILLEDLNESGFEMLNRFQALSNEGVRLVIRDLAIYHSLSYVFKNSEPDTYKEIVEKMFNMWASFADDPHRKSLLEMTDKDFAQLMNDENQKYKNFVKEASTQMCQSAKKLEIYEKGSKYSVIQHGDCWNNNIMFRFEDGKPVQDVMIDYQISKESNPAADILCLILNCTDHASRLKHYQEWIDYYHETLNESLNNYGLKANRIFPKDQLDADLRRYGRTMIQISMMLSNFITRESKDAWDMTSLTTELTEEDMAQMSASNLDPSTKAKLKERIMGVIDSGLELGLVSL